MIGSAEHDWAHKAVLDAMRSYGYKSVRTFTSRNAFREHMKETAASMGKDAGSILDGGELGMIGVDCAHWSWDTFYGKGPIADPRKSRAPHREPSWRMRKKGA